jgi:hypothetical protein
MCVCVLCSIVSGEDAKEKVQRRKLGGSVLNVTLAWHTRDIVDMWRMHPGIMRLASWQCGLV